jgi:phosphoribosyl-ATP pyrophosphohydrolase
VLWADAGIKPGDVYAILAAREGISGIAEKEQRKHTSGGN